MKKRINDLSILKSSNNSILNQKITKLMEENKKLAEENRQLESGKVSAKQHSSKPYLFGP